MLKNYLLSAIRNIARNKFYTFLNVLGLSLGLAAFIFILLYVQDELSYDKHHEKHHRIYRVESDFTIGQKHDKFAIVPIPMGPALKLEYPEIEQFVRMYGAGNTIYRLDGREFSEERFYFTDSTVFDVFTHELVIGDLKQSLNMPNQIVMTESTAKRYFGEENPIGQVIVSERDVQFKVTAVVKDVPNNSHLKFDALLSGATIAALQGPDQFNSMEPGRFWNIGVYTYVLLNENADMATIHEKFNTLYDKYMKPIGDQINASFDLMSTPLADVHLTSKLSSDLPTGNIVYVYIFSVVALFILLLAAINYMNMATARSANRAKEVGVRKVLGAYKVQLIRQFLSESVFLTLIALVLAIVVVLILLPDFNTLSGKELQLSISENPMLFVQVLIVTVLVGLLSGSYPAFYLSSFIPVKVLKGTVSKTGKKGGILRKVLVVFQFWIAIVMIIGSIVISNQIDFLKNKDLGFNKENVVVVPLPDTTVRNKIETFKDGLLSNPDIISAANSSGIPGQNGWIQVLLVEQESEMKEFAVILTQADFDFVKTMEYELLEGRDFDELNGMDDTAAVIINEAAVRQFGWADTAVGRKFIYGFDIDDNGQLNGGRELRVIGVLKDYHFQSLHNVVEPIIIFISPVPRYYLSVRFQEGKLKETLGFLEEHWNSFGAKRPFDFELLRNIQVEMYDAEEKISLIFNLATLLTIVIAILGLLGLSSFVAEQRTREFGIRKIVGASVGDILMLLYKEFALLITIAFALAIPLAWWQLQDWLSKNFVYHVEMNWWTFLISGIAAVVIGLVTISYFVIKAANNNPVEAIKYE